MQMQSGQVYVISYLGEKDVVTVVSEDLEETGVYGLYTEQELETYDSCDWTYSPKKGLLFQGQVPRFPIVEFKRIR